MAPQNPYLSAELDWLCNTPDLMLPPHSQTRPIALQQPVTDSTALETTYEPSHRLGDHFENLVFQYLNCNTQVTDIKRNIQIHEELKTLGEIDFLVQLQHHWLHLEVALKLYLLDGTGDSLTHFIGTRRDDRLANKWHHMLDKQLRLSNRPEAKYELAALGIEQPVDTALWVKGWLFYRQGKMPGNLPAPVNPQHSHGWWITQAELPWLKRAGHRFLLPSKKQWLLPPSLIDPPLMDFAGLVDRVMGSQRSLLALVVDAEGRERSRGFIVPDQWSESRL
jgi:hypothetical protein